MSNKAWRIDKSSLGMLTGRLLTLAKVVAPVRNSAGDVNYEEIKDPKDVAWDYNISVASLKRFLAPQVEPLFDYSKKESGLSLEPSFDRSPRVFLGVRPCDVSGVNFLDTVYTRDYDDPYYLARRQNSLFIALACNTAAAETCFCVCGDGGPFLKEGFDLQFVDLGDYYLVEVGSTKGEALIKENSDLFSPADENDLAARAQLAKGAETSFGDHKSYVAAALRKLSTGKSSEETWENMEDLCIACGGCSFVCPTCTCFTVFDQEDSAGGVRQRHWDSCNYACYSREASGHNPRKNQSQRLKGRFFHKLSYQFVQRNGRQACVGCGRCVNVCMGDDAMPEVTARIRRGE